jgi:dephospho-CoA kinase
MSIAKKKIFFIVGNYGVGKSTLIDQPILSQTKMFLEIRNNVYVLGNKIIGADSLSAFKKEYVLKEIKRNTDKNILIAGNYYCQIKDFEELRSYFDLVLCYLKTDFENNLKRISQRGKTINVATYNNKLKNHISLIKKTNGIRKLYIIDNNRTIQEVKDEFYKILDIETNEKNRLKTS